MWSAPCGNGNDLIGAELQASVCADGVMTQQNVHDTKKLLDALVLTEVLPTLDQKGMIPLIVPADDQALRATNGGHHLYLQGKGEGTYWAASMETPHLDTGWFKQQHTLSSKPVIFV